MELGKGYAGVIARSSLAIGSIKLSPKEPFTWASGFQMPIYNDNRMLLFDPRHRRVVTEALHILARERADYDNSTVIAGTSTAGIAPARGLADKLEAPLIYVRDKPKGHGLRNRIEGIDAEKGLEGRSVILVEDLISTGGSSAKAVQAIRDAGGKIGHCISIFNYGLEVARKMFAGEEPFDDSNRLDPKCEAHSALDYDALLQVAKETGAVQGPEIEMLKQWREDPFGWGDANGFPKVEKA